MARKTPIITVAANDSHPDAKELTDFVCEGVNDQVEIQAALDSVVAAGGIVRLVAGNYLVSKQTGKDFAIRFQGSNKQLLLDSGAVIKLADGQFPISAGYVIKIGEGLDILFPDQVLERNLGIWGPGTIDVNQANGNTQAGGVDAQGHLHQFHIGGGLLVTNAGSPSLPVSISGLSFGGQPQGLASAKHTVVSDLHITDSLEGMFLVTCDDTTIDNLHISNIINQDGIEPISCRGLTMTNSSIRDTAGSAVDAFTGVGAVSSDHVYAACVFGPTKSGTVAAIAIGIAPEGSHINHALIGCVINLGPGTNVIGVSFGDNGAGAATIVGTKISECTINGVLAGAGSDGIVVGPDADKSLILSNQISDCAGNAIVVPASLANIQIRNNGGWGNGAGIARPTPPATSYATDNNFDP